MSNIRFALIAGVLALTPLTAGAATITESFSAPDLFVTGDEVVAVTPFAQFNPANGTLNSISTTIGGEATWTSYHSPDTLTVALMLHGTNESVGPYQLFFSPGSILIDMSGTDNFTPDFLSLTGTGTATLDFVVHGSSSDTLESRGGLDGSITYDFTPVPEPPALALFGGGLVTLAFLRRRNGAFKLR